MKKVLTFCLLICMQQYLHGQCNVAIPPNAVVVDNDTTLGMVSQIFWVCSGDTLSGSGVYNTYYVESGGVLDMSGIEKIVYLKTGAAILCSGIDDTIYHEPGAIINCSGNHVDIPCAQIVFNYDNAPPNGCAVTAVPAYELQQQSLVVRPCKKGMLTEINIYALQAATTHIIVHDVNGRSLLQSQQKVLKGKNRLLLKTDRLQSGIYHILVHNQYMMLSEKLLVY